MILIKRPTPAGSEHRRRCQFVLRVPDGLKRQGLHGRPEATPPPKPRRPCPRALPTKARFPHTYITAGHCRSNDERAHSEGGSVRVIDYLNEESPNDRTPLPGMRWNRPCAGETIVATGCANLRASLRAMRRQGKSLLEPPYCDGQSRPTFRISKDRLRRLTPRGIGEKQDQVFARATRPEQKHDNA